MNEGFMKRIFDLSIAVPFVILLTPVFVVTGFFVRIRTGSPVLFRQVRP